MRNYSKWLFLVLSVICLLLVIISSNDPIISIFESTFFESILINSLSGNSVLFNLSMGIAVSTIFYLIVVYFPEKQKQKDIQPQIEQYISEILTRSWSLVSKTIEHSGKEYVMGSITKEEFMDACSAFNPKKVMHTCHNDTGTFFRLHYGYICSGNWDVIEKNINSTMYFLPYVDTGLVKILNKIRSSSLSGMIGMLRNIDTFPKNEDMKPWSSSIYEVYTLSVELETYYKCYINKNFKHPFRKI